jgi:2'-5' RNA ligase
MLKLFVAIDLPVAVIPKLVALQPLPVRGLRLVAPDQMHLTLLFLGEVHPDRFDGITNRLAKVDVGPFSFDIHSVGQFPSVGGATTLWAGVPEKAELLALHATVHEALLPEGFQPEVRRYNPHITLARCESEVPSEVVSDWLLRHREFMLPTVEVSQFTLFSSEFRAEVPVYHRLQVFPLSRTNSSAQR